jgi:hypothetical protein
VLAKIFKNANFLAFCYGLSVMKWILLMIVFSQPFEVGHVDVLGQYPDEAKCNKAMNRALAIFRSHRTEAPERASFGCLGIGKTDEQKGISAF